MSTTTSARARLSAAERAAFTVEADQDNPNAYHVRVAAPDGRFAQWWVYPRGDGYVLCNRPDPGALIRAYPDFDRATRAANLRARHWLGSCWGLRGPARRLP
jgi:hypothetical protein